MNISGIIKLINETKEYGSNGFKKREIVVTTQEQYPQNIMVEFIQDRCELLDAFNTGDFVKVDINLRGREWVNKDGETKYFNSIQGWRIEKTQQEGNPLPPIPDLGTIDDGTPEDTDSNSEEEVKSEEEDTDDLPF